jgi:hypothetical protein
MCEAISINSNTLFCFSGFDWFASQAGFASQMEK